MSAATLSAERMCRSDCRRPVVVEIVAVSPSGRRRSSCACDDAEHQAGIKQAMRALGFVPALSRDLR